MPRIDNSNDDVIGSFGLEFDPDDPGKTNPVDLCWYCFVQEGWEGFDIDHPPYDDGDYTCYICGATLMSDDN